MDISRRDLLRAGGVISGAAALGAAGAFRPGKALAASAFPSRVHVAANRILDASGADLGQMKGFTVQVSPSHAWPAADFAAMAALSLSQGRVNGCVRHVIFWDQMEPSPGSLDAAYLANLDTSIANATAAGLYSMLDCPHLNTGQIPSWAATEASEWLDLQVHGQNLISTIAARYASNLGVIGLNPNEPPAADLPSVNSGYNTIVPWYRDTAPKWPLWLQGCRYGGGTPYPAGAGLAPLDPAQYKALDTHLHGCIIEYHDYCEGDGGDLTTYPYGFLPSGLPARKEDVTGGWLYATYAYPDTAQSRADLASHIKQGGNGWPKFVNTHGSFAFAIGEWGIGSTGAEGAFGTDKAAAFNSLNIRPQVQMWWDYDVAALSSNPFSARPGGTWRAAVTNWMAQP